MKLKIHLIFIVFSFACAATTYGYQFQLTPRLVLTEEYTDNLFLSEDNKDHDFITTIAPGLTLDVTGKTQGVSITYEPSYAMYAEFSENDTLRHSAEFTGWADLQKNTRLDIRDSFIRTEDPLSESDIAAPQAPDGIVQPDSTIRRNREPYYRNTANARLTHRFGESDSIYADYTYGILENNDSTVEDNASHNPEIGLTYWFRPQLGLETIASYTRGKFSSTSDVTDPSDDFDNLYGSLRLIKKITRQLEGNVQYVHTYQDFKGEEEDYHIFNPGIGLSYAPSADTLFTAEIGYFFQDNAESDNKDGLTGSSTFRQSFRRGAIDLNAAGGYDEAYFGAENLGFSIFYEMGARAEYEFLRLLRGDIYGSYRRARFEDIDPERTEKTARVGLGLSYQLQRWLALRLGYSHRMVKSTQEEDEYKENRALFTITLTPSQPIRLKP